MTDSKTTDSLKHLTADDKAYLGIASKLPRPTIEQTYRFCWFVSAAHSWYKHLPLMHKVPFLFYLDPCAGMSWVYRGDESKREEITDQSTRFHYTWQTTETYRRRFGYWSYHVSNAHADPSDLSGFKIKIIDDQGEALLVSSSVLWSGAAQINAVVHPYFSPGARHADAPLPTLLKKWKEEAAHSSMSAVKKSPTSSLRAPLSSSSMDSARYKYVQERVKAIVQDPMDWRGSNWLSHSVLDENWAALLENQGFSPDEINLAFKELQAELVFALSDFRARHNSSFHRAVAQERNRQLHAMREAMLRFTKMVYGSR